MIAALERGLWPGVDGCLSARTTYDQLWSFFSAIDLALVTFAVEKSLLCGITLLCFGSVAPTGYIEEAQLLLHAS
jgi:hypothetical protein